MLTEKVCNKMQEVGTFEQERSEKEVLSIKIVKMMDFNNCHIEVLFLNITQFLFLYIQGAGIAQLVVLGLAVHSVAGSILLWGHFQ